MRQQKKQVEKHLIYTSRVLGRIGGVGLGELNRTCRAHNSRLGVTGLLLCHQGRFFGVLEGRPDLVDDRFARIMRDRRHGEVKILSQAAIASRAFDWWKMGVTDPETLPKLMRRGVFAISDMTAPNCPERGATDDVRGMVRKHLASFSSLTTEPLKVAI